MFYLIKHGNVRRSYADDRFFFFLGKVAYRGTVVIPTVQNSTGIFRLIFEYASTVQATGTVTLLSINGDTRGGNIAVPSDCTTRCFVYTSGTFSLKSETWNVFVNFANSLTSGNENRLTLIRVIALPEEFYNASIFGSRSAEFSTKCDVLRNNMSIGTADENYCVQGVFSLTMGYMKNPFSKCLYHCYQNL